LLLKPEFALLLEKLPAKATPSIAPKGPPIMKPTAPPITVDHQLISIYLISKIHIISLLDRVRL
jgi:hypothetical protein